MFYIKDVLIYIGKLVSTSLPKSQDPHTWKFPDDLMDCKIKGRTFSKVSLEQMSPIGVFWICNAE